MKLRKINDIHFVITHGNPTTNGDYAIHSITLNVSQHHSKDNSLSEGWEKIEFSTQPLDERGYWGKVMPLTLTISEIKELIGGVDVEKKAEKFIGCEYEEFYTTAGIYIPATRFLQKCRSYHSLYNLVHSKVLHKLELK